ncbi:MAG TPA: methyltransferase [Chitinivibrionales bacterium]|nr:methyltransferase [Chitinivibrionales bacterium]
MPFKLNFLERQIFLERNWGPGPFIDMLAPLAFKAVAAALKLGVFEALNANGALSLAALCEKTRADRRGMALLASALVGLGYLRGSGASRYAITAMARRWMLAGSASGIAGMAGYFEDAADRWTYLDKSIRAGGPAQACDGWLNGRAGAWERYHAGMHGVARLLAGEIVSAAAVPTGAKRLIDIGGGHGLYSVMFCRRHPSLSATVFDWKQARSLAEKTIGEHGMQNRIRFVAGDFFEDDLGAGYDVALLFNVLRIYPEDKIRFLLKKAGAALAAGGRLFIADQFSTKKLRGFAKVNEALVLLELYNSCAGAVLSSKGLMAMLRDTEFGRCRELFLKRGPGISIVEALRK